VGVVLCGCFPERFFNLCKNREIRLWNIEKRQEGYVFYLSVKDYKRLKPIVRKTKTRPKIRVKKGLPFLLQRLKKRVGLLIGGILFCGLLYTYSLFLWSIEIEGGYTHTEVALKKYLKTIEVEVGKRKSQLDCTAIEEALRKEYKDIGWVSCEIKGSKMVIKIKETLLVEEKEDNEDPIHLIAPAEGEIASIIVRKGTLMVRKGDKVAAGDILISGIVDIYGDNDLLLEKKAVAADGDIYLNRYLSYRQEYPLNVKKKEYTKEKKISYTLRILGYEISLDNPLKSLENWEQYDIIGERKLYFFGVELQKKEYKAFTLSDTKRSQEEVESLANAWFSYYLEELSKEGIVLLENQVKLTLTKESCVAKGQLYVSWPVGTYRKITDNEWRNIETDEYSGNDN
jgi:similar to stage IV sporulation protein